MARLRALKVLLVVAGLLFICGLYPIAMYLWHPGNESPGDMMMLSLYVTMGVFLLIAVRDPSGYRSMIAYAAWANMAHATVMALMAIHPGSDRKGLLTGTVAFGVIGVLLLVLAPAKPSSTQTPAST